MPAKFDGWVKAAPSGPGSIYNRADNSVVVSFQAGSDYNGMQDYVKHSRTKVGSGVCGTTELAASLVCYLKTADGVLSLAADANETPLVALVDFADQLTKTLGTS